VDDTKDFRTKPPEDEPNTFKYANDNFRERDPLRELDDTELIMLIARYQETACDTAQAAKFVNITEDRAWKIIDELSDKDPRILTDPKIMKAAGMMLMDTAAQCHRAYRAFLDKPNLKHGRLTQSEDYARTRGMKLLAAWADTKNVVSADTPEELAEAESGIDRELERLLASTKARGPQGPEAGTPAATGVGEDDGPEDERT